MIRKTNSHVPTTRLMRRGASVVETAFVLPIVLIFIFGAIDVAMILYAYNTVGEASRTGARYAMVHGSRATSPVGPTANNATVETVVRANSPVLESTRLTVTSSWGASSNDSGCPVTVTATYNCPLVCGQLVGFGTVTLTGTTTMLITH